MTDMERKTFCAALSRYGAQAQITMVFEEMAELQDVLCKFLRGRAQKTAGTGRERKRPRPW